MQSVAFSKFIPTLVPGLAENDFCTTQNDCCYARNDLYKSCEMLVCKAFQAFRTFPVPCIARVSRNRQPSPGNCHTAS